MAFLFQMTPCFRFSCDSERAVLGDFDVILAGDLLFDDRLGSAVARLAASFVRSDGIFLLGDPGRWLMAEKGDASFRAKLEGVGLGLGCVAKYELSEDCRREHFGFSAGYVYRLFPNRECAQ